MPISRNAPHHEDVSQRGTKIPLPLTGSMEQPVLRCLRGYDHLDKNKDQTWEFDYTVFDRWVEFMMVRYQQDDQLLLSSHGTTRCTTTIWRKESW